MDAKERNYRNKSNKYLRNVEKLGIKKRIFIYYVKILCF